MTSKIVVSARVQVTVEIGLAHETWSGDSSAEQIHREASELAIKRITELCQRYVRLVGVPRVETISQVKEVR